MEQNTPHSARKGRILIGVFLIFIITFLLVLFFSHFRYYNEVKIEDTIIGYYKTKDEFENRYAQIATNTITNDGYEAVSYLETKPITQTKLITKEKAQSFNKKENLYKALKTDYTIYVIQINDKDLMYCKTKEKAEEKEKEIINNIKKGMEVHTIAKVVNNPKEIQILECSDQLVKQTIETNKPKITNRSGVVRSVKSTKVSSNFIWPIGSRRISSPFGMRHGKLHTGVDISTPSNSAVKSAQAGIVIQAGWCGGYGNYVKVKHDNGIVTGYAHNNKLLVSKGQRVAAGQLIAYSGSTGNSTGPHLHFEVIVNGKFQNPLNYF